RDARLIVGAHGAGLANIAFSRPGTVLYELFPSFAAARPYYNILAQGRGVHYWADVFDCPAPACVTTQSLRAARWQVDLSLVDRRLSEIAVRR
ncbi:MAG TPA: glycosyltransferase family 61 protein, partial [Rhodopila sp.]